MEEHTKQFNLKNILVIILIFLLGWQLGHKNFLVTDKQKTNVQFKNTEVPENINVDFKLFWDTWDLVSKLYLDKDAIDPNKLF